MKKIAYTLLFFICIIHQCYTQSTYERFKTLSSPKKWWVVFHPLKAKKALAISYEAQQIADSIRKTKTLGKITSGTKLDAFRHSFWMAYLGQHIGENPARLLGKAHERENYLFFKENKLEDGTLPDKPSMDMDLHNNEVGLSLIERKSVLNKKQLIEKVILNINQGKMRILKRDKKNRYVTCKGAIISKDSLRVWDNRKCLIPSNSI